MTPFGLQLSDLRRRRGLQQQQLADLLQVAPCYISAMEKGRKGPPTEHLLEAITTGLQLTPEEKTALLRAAECSQRQRRVPKDVSVHEYALVDELWKRLGSISQAEATAISSILKINQKETYDEEYLTL